MIPGRFLVLLSGGLILALTVSGKSAPKGDTLRKKYKRSLFAVPTLGSAPETGFYFGAVGLADFLPVHDSLARHSVVKTEFSYTAKKQFILNLDWTLTDTANRYILAGKNAWMRFPELYWGIGGKTPNQAEVLYDAYRLELSNQLYRKLSPGLYAGIAQQFQSVYKSRFPDFEPGNAAVYQSLQTGISSGLGLALLYDTRSNLLNPRPGEVLASFQTLGFGGILGSDFQFAGADADLRYYLKTGHRNLLAFQTLAQFRSKGAPYRMLAMLGGPMMLRGYYFGRFRDQNLFAVQTEWRWDFSRWVGMTAFGAVGDAVSFSETSRNGSLKSAAGLGIRIKVDPKENTNMRFDFAGTDRGDFGFYVSFGEAF